MQKISISIRLVIAALTISVAASAQRVELYTLTLPKTILDGGGSLFVKNLTNSGTEEATFGEVYAKTLANILKVKDRGIDKDAKLLNPWLTTSLYQVVESETEADFVISGEYQFASSSSNTFEEKFIRETSNALDQNLPISYFSYTASSEASLAVEAVITKKDGSVITTLPFGDRKVKSATMSLEKPNVPSPSSFISDLSNDAIIKTGYTLTASLDTKKVRFEGLKTKNKEIKKEYKELDNQAEKLLKADNFNAAGKILFQIAALEESEDVFFNIATCYELIGNYTKAKEYYDKSGDKSGIKRINEMIAVRDKLKSLGIPITENEF